MILGAYLHKRPEALSFATGQSGKPYLAPASLQFNLSHAGDLALVAVCRDIRVGVDIERRHEVAEMEAILLKYFSEAERNFVDFHAGEERTRAFFLLWTRREAAAKALGLDLITSFDRLSLPSVPPSPAGFQVALPESTEGPVGSGSWWMRDLCPAPGYAGALCAEGGEAKLCSWRFRPASG
jgi:4'-phosphopantetheinyl transferase